MWKEHNAWQTETETNYARKWYDWLVADGQWLAMWDDLKHDSPFEGLEREDVIREYGGYADQPMYSYTNTTNDNQRYIEVYSLDRRSFADEEIKEVEEFRNTLPDDSYEWFARVEPWEAAHPDLAWYWDWKHIYPASHLVFVDYWHGDKTIETHAIFCRTYADMLNVLKLHG